MKDNDISDEVSNSIGNKNNDGVEIVEIIIPSGWATKCNSDEPDIIATLTTTLGSDA